jgi:hypothetical protein
VRFRHESGSPEYKVYGFWDGDGQGGIEGNIFKVRFCPTKPGRWKLVEVSSNRPELKGQGEGVFLNVTAGKHPGFWLPDDESSGRRWFKRSDGSHPYILGNTHYSFLSGHGPDGKPVGNDIAKDIEANAAYFKKLRFALTADRYPHPTEKPFLDTSGKPSDDGRYAHRPNPRWFHERVDLAVHTAYEHDLIADLILCGPDTVGARSTLAAEAPEAWLKYIAARYGSYPNVWICLCNEYDIKQPKYSEERIAQFGSKIREYLPYPTPLSVHAAPNPGAARGASNPPAWHPKFDEFPDWNDHQIIQRKIRSIGPSADIIRRTCEEGRDGKPRNKPTINDELSYQGEGDKHSELDTIAAHVGALLGGGYGTTGWKPGNKLGHYFWGKFDPSQHTAADNLQYLRQVVDQHITFWRMRPGTEIFSNLDAGSRALEWPNHEYLLGTETERSGIVAKLPAGAWTVTQYDIVNRQSKTLADAAQGQYRFDAPNSRAVLFHFQRNP